MEHTLENNPIRTYWEQMNNNQVIVCDKLYRTYKKIIYDMDNPGEYFYSPSRAEHILIFIEKFCRHSKGKLAGKLVELELWEKAMLSTVFGFINNKGARKYKFCEIILGKKNGKSLISSCVGLYLMIGDSEGGAEVYSVATQRSQASIIWKESRLMARKSEFLSKKIKTLSYEMTSEFNDSIFKPLASDQDTLDGLNIHGGLMDEIHQWKNGRPLFNIIADGVSAREQPLIFVTTTAGVIREDIYDELYDEGVNLINSYSDENGCIDERSIYFIYELDNKEEMWDESKWQKANPGIGSIKKWEYLKERVEKARYNSTFAKNVLTKEFNIRETGSESFLSFEELNNIATYNIKDLGGRYCCIGIDLSETTDLTAVTVLFRVPDREEFFVEQMYWLPEDLLNKREKEDKIPYTKWVNQGLMRTTPGNRIDYKVIVDYLLEVQEKHDLFIYNIGYDAWSAGYLVQELKQIFGEGSCQAIHQGMKTLSAPMKELKALLDKKLINYNNNSILKWCMSNVAVKEDINGNIQPVKTSNSRRRIDGFCSLLDAFISYQNVQEEYMTLI